MMTDDEMETPPPMPRVGPCGVCGWHPDQRHRIRDAILGRLLAGEDAETVCADYNWTPEQVMALHLDIDANLVGDEMADVRGPLVSMRRFAELAGLQYQTMRNRRARGRLPEPVTVVGSMPLWSPAQVRQWLWDTQHDGAES